MVARKILCLNVFVCFLLVPRIVSGQTNAVTGVVHDSQGRPLGGVDVFEVRHKNEIADITRHEDGLYCLKIAKSIPTYQLQYHKDNYIDHVDLKPIPNNVDPRKREIVVLLGKKDVEDAKESLLRRIVKAQVIVWHSAREQRKSIIILEASKSNLEFIDNNINPNLTKSEEIRKEIKNYIAQINKDILQY